MSSTTFQTPLPGRFRPLAADAHAGGKVPAPGSLRTDPAMAHAGMWTTPRDLMALAAAINASAVPQMLTGHPVEARMGLGVFLNSGSGITWWSHAGSVAGFECASRLYGSGPLRLSMLPREGIGAAIRMNNHHLSALGSYRLPGGQLVTLTVHRRALDGPGIGALVVYEPPYLRKTRDATFLTHARAGWARGGMSGVRRMVVSCASDSSAARPGNLPPRTHRILLPHAGVRVRG